MPLQNSERNKIKYVKNKKIYVYTNCIVCHTTIQIENTKPFNKIYCKDCNK